jgi:phosphoglycerol transferase MdoB-like AlkP superfamily enzyme
MASEYWDDTVFLVVADHDERVGGGGSLVPVSRFHIPGLILGGSIQSRRVEKIASQIDMIPTLLALANLYGVAPILGQDVLSLPQSDPGRAIMQFGDNHAFMVGENVVIHQPGLSVRQYQYRHGGLIECTLDTALERRALAMAQLPGYLYRERLYHQIESVSFGDHQHDW